MHISNPSLLTTEPEKKYNQSIPIQHRKTFGQVFTPETIAQFMVQWIIATVQSGRLLDPALGMGIFFRQLLSMASQDLEASTPSLADYTLEGFELDPDMAQMTTGLFLSLPLNLTCHQEDFLLTEGHREYDGIICNPPYIHFQDYQHSLELIQSFNQKYQLQLNGFSNIYALFLIKSLQQLKQNGRAAFILPSEFLNADYGKSIKEWLITNKNLAHLLVFDSKIQLFDGFLTTSAILLFEGREQNCLQMYNVKKFADLHQIGERIFHGVDHPSLEVREYPYEQLDPAVKWKHYYSDFKYRVQIIKGNSHQNSLVSFEHFARIRRGIATGANDFFTLTPEEVAHWQINPRYLSPCLTRASHVRKQIFRQLDYAQLSESNKKVYLLNLADQKLDASLQAYLKWGVEQGYHNRYLTRHRNPWYRMESSSPADLLVKTFGRKPAVFIENQTQVLNLTCFHGIHLNPLGQQYRQVIFLYLLTDLAREVFEGQKREYGLGLGKFEPNDIKQASVLDFTQVMPEDLRECERLYQAYLATISQNDHGCKSNTHLQRGKEDEPLRKDDSEKKIQQILQQAEAIFFKYWA